MVTGVMTELGVGLLGLHGSRMIHSYATWCPVAQSRHPGQDKGYSLHEHHDCQACSLSRQQEVWPCKWAYWEPASSSGVSQHARCATELQAMVWSGPIPSIYCQHDVRHGWGSLSCAVSIHVGLGAATVCVPTFTADKVCLLIGHELWQVLA